MRRKSKKSISDSLKNGNRNKRKAISEDCIYIGKENIERWINLKTKFNFSSNNEFATYLLDLFVDEKCSFIKVPIEKKSGESALGLSVTDGSNISEEDCKTVTLPSRTNCNKIDYCSSVIVVNKTSKTDDHNEDTLNSKTEFPTTNVRENSQSCCAGVSVNSKQLNGIEEVTSDSQESGFHTDVQGGDSCTDSQEEIINPSKGSNAMDQEKTTVGNLDVHKIELYSDLSVKLETSNQNEKQQIVIDPINTCSSEPNQKKNKKKKVCNVKERGMAVEEVISKFKKKKVHISSLGSDSIEKENDDSKIIPSMQVEHSGTYMNTEFKELEQGPTTCERVAITIKLCVDCDLHHVQDACPLKKPISQVHDAVTLEQWTNGQEKKDSMQTYAEASLPSCLELRNAGEEYVVARQPLQAFLQFGPLVGQEIKEKEIPDDSSMEHIWELADSSGCCYMSTISPAHSNWLRFVRPAPVRSSRNLEVILCEKQLVFVTTTALNIGEELLFWAENTNSAWSQKKLCKTKCGGCNLSFPHTLYYRLHCAVFHDPAYSLTVRKYHCKVCGLSVLGKENIVKHAADSHNGKGAYQCQFCHKFFLRLNYLEMHRTYGCSANPNRARPLCDYCGRKFCQPQKLKVHIKRMHSEMLEVLRDFQCQHCLKVLGSRPALQRHIREVHQKDVVGASTCDRCGKMFQNKSNLKIHMLTHSGVKPFKCQKSECQSAFTTKQCLQFHYRKVHGLEAGHMPLIERSVEYTFDAYSGSRRPNSVNTDSQCSSEGEDTPDKSGNDDPSLSPPISVTGDPMDSLPFEGSSRTVVSKGSKKWMGEFIDSGHSAVFDIDEDDKDQDINVSQIDEEPIPMLIHQCKQDSANASLLVEAALDAAEKEIDIPAKISSPVALVISKETYTGLRETISHSPLSLSRPVSPVEYPVQDQSQSPQLAMDSCYSTSMSPRHPYSLMFPERTPHYDFRLSPPPSQMETFHLDEPRYELHRRTEENSGDEGLSEAQNLSLGLKNKVLQLEIPYKYDALEERGFDSVEGLDMSRTSGYHHPFVSVTPRYPHALYESRTYSHTDVLRVVNFSHSVDLSLPRSHHQLTPPISQTMIEPIRIMSPPPPPYQAYPLSTSPYNRPPLSPTYHHYSTTY